MPTNKNALLRFQILDRCFSDRSRKYEIDDLLEKVNDALYDIQGTTIGLRQIRDDIQHMRDRVAYNAPIEAIPFDGRRCYYRYKDPDFSIFNHELSAEEVTKLRSTIEMLGRFRGVEQNEWLEEVISNFEIRFGVKPNKENIVTFDQNKRLKGIEFLSTIIDATVSHKPLLIKYQNYKGNEETVTIHPYHVKEFNNRWFLFGLEESNQGNHIANRALDRIGKLSFSDVSFIPNTTIDFTTYFDDVIGVTIPENTEVEHIILKFEKERFPYVVSKPMHKSQKIISKEECIIQINVRPNNELSSSIFSYFPDVEVLEPLWYRNIIREKIIFNMQKYNL